MSEDRIEKILKNLKRLNSSQLLTVDRLTTQLLTPFVQIIRNDSSDIVTEEILWGLGDTLRMHHGLSKEAFSKDKFEYALERVLLDSGVNAQLARTGNPGNDIEIEGIKVSLKTQADGKIKRDFLWISKFMELGKGKWGNDPEDLNNLMTMFLNHMRDYERIFSLRCLNKGPRIWTYELVEIPLELLHEAKDGRLEMKLNSKQSPKPGYCYVYDRNERLKFQLYFDGGGERKLQISKLRKDLCIVHASWSFEITTSG